MKIIRFTIFFVLLAASVCWTGCEMFASHTNPIPNWKFCYSDNPIRSNEAVKADYQAYIQKIPPHKYQFIGSVSFTEDGTGQHAVTIQEGRNDTYWNHVLIYDKDNKRIKVIIYVSGHYRS